ncbi:MAG: glycosyltransferase [Bacteroidales bacterium]|nr:glycosyltransferase [Bacteroidales bacterium]
MSFRSLNKDVDIPISVIICAKNEGENLRKNLPIILKQDYPDFEVIVVNDCSQDDTDFVVSDLMKEHKNLRITNIQPDRKFTHGKKLAVTVGIKSAQNECLVLTDADCFPVSDNWLKRIAVNFTNNDIVLGYGGYKHGKGLLNLYIRYDTAFIAIQYLGFARAGIPYMGVGRNLAYKKDVFFNNKGFASHYGLISGDDDLFINETANKKNTCIEIHPESHTRSEPKKKWGDFFNQKIRHYTTAHRYKPKHAFMLGFEPLMRLGFYVSFALLLAIQLYPIVVLSIFSLRLFLQIWLGIIIMRRLKDRKLVFLLPFFDVLSILINLLLLLSSTIRVRKQRWN